MRHELICRGRTLAVELTRDGDGHLLQLEDRRVPVEVLESRDGRLELLVDGRRRTAYAVRDGGRVLVFCDGRTWEVQEADDDADTDQGGPVGGPRITAEMPGKVVKVLVEPGRRVAAGEAVLVLEAMKMETEIAAGVAGIVAAVHVTAGQTVAQDELLVEIDPDTEEEDDD